MVPVTLSLDNVNSGYILMESAHLTYLPCHKQLQTVACIPYDLTNMGDLMPVLMDISSLGIEQRREISEILELQRLGLSPPIVCALLITDTDIKQVAEQIGKFLSAIDEEGISVYWRFFDPRVFSLTWVTFSVEQRSVLLGYIREWNFPWRGYWWSARQTQYLSDWSLRIESAFPTYDQWPTIKLSRILDQALLKIEDELKFSADDCLKFQNAAIALLIEASKKFHLHDPDELIDYIFMGLKYSISFTAHPELAAAVKEISNGKLRWFSFKKTMNHNRLRTFDIRDI